MQHYILSGARRLLLLLAGRSLQLTGKIRFDLCTQLEHIHLATRPPPLLHLCGGIPMCKGVGALSPTHPPALSHRAEMMTR